MSAVTRSISASEVARGLSIFEIDESLAALVEAAEAEIARALYGNWREEHLFALRQALELYQQFVKEFPGYPDLLTVYQKMLPLAKDLQKTADAEKIQEEIKRLQPAAGK